MHNLKLTSWIFDDIEDLYLVQHFKDIFVAPKKPTAQIIDNSVVQG